MVNRICDALLKAFGGDFQTGITTFATIGSASFGYNTNFPATFNQTDGPCVLVSPLGSNVDQWQIYTGFTSVSGFSLWGERIGGGPAAGNFAARWVAWYP
jgi:hypothetical protein